MDSLVKEPVSPRGAPKTIVEPVVCPPEVLPPHAIATTAATAITAHLRIAVTPINRLARCNAHLNPAFPHWRGRGGQAAKSRVWRRIFHYRNVNPEFGAHWT